jgi:AcrR family transcriptional regulator
VNITPKRPGPGRPRSLVSERAILDATIDLLAREGYSVLTLDKVAAQARVSKSTIYRRWPSKEHLVIAAFDTTPPLVSKGEGTVVDELVDLLAQFVGVTHSTPLAGVLPTLLGERAHNHALAEVLDPLVERRRGPLRQALKRGIRSGVVPKNTNIELAVDAVMGPVCLRRFFLRGDVNPRALREIVKVALRGLGATI